MLSLDRKSGSVAVFLVDYGPSEIVEKKWIRRSVVYQEIPVQTFNGRLVNSNTLLSNTEFSDCGAKTSDRFGQLLMNRLCTITVKNLSPLQVSLQCNLVLNLD